MRSRIFIAVTIVAAILVIAAAWSLYSVFVRAPMELAGATAKGVQEFFNFTPRVTIDQTVVIEANVPIMEVATVSRQLMVDHSWSHTWLGSTKTIHMVGTFTAKAGFDLREPFTIAIDKNPLRVTATMPLPKILSLSMDSFHIAADESGWWNKVSDADRETAVRDLQSTARAQAESSGILDQVRSSAEERIRDIVQKNGATVKFVSSSGIERETP